MAYLQVLILVSFSTPMLISAAVSESASACLNTQMSALTFECPQRTMIRITKTFYGLSQRPGMCSYEIGDCVQEDYQPHMCVGGNKCSVNLTSGKVGRTIPKCPRQEKSNYYQVNYECVSVDQVKDICAASLITNQKGYLATPNYPRNYKESLKCSVKFQVEEYQKIRLYIMDMNLEINATSKSCVDYMLAQDKEQTLTLCNRRYNEQVRTAWSNNLTITFNSSPRTNKKGFWLYYEAYPTLTTTTRKVTTPRVTSAPHVPMGGSGSNPGSQGTIPVTKTVSNINTNKTEKLPFAAIVGGVIGTLSLILVVLLILLLVKWTRERRQKQDKNQFIEVQNPGYRNSNEFQPSGPRHDICYNYVDY